MRLAMSVGLVWKQLVGLPVAWPVQFAMPVGLGELHMEMRSEQWWMRLRLEVERFFMALVLISAARRLSMREPGESPQA